MSPGQLLAFLLVLIIVSCPFIHSKGLDAFLWSFRIPRIVEDSPISCLAINSYYFTVRPRSSSSSIQFPLRISTVMFVPLVLPIDSSLVPPHLDGRSKEEI